MTMPTAGVLPDASDDLSERDALYHPAYCTEPSLQKNTGRPPN